jgi:molecular chaperone DnaK
VNQGDTLIFQTEKQLKEFGDKIPADKKQPIEDALVHLKKVHAEKDVIQIKAAIEKLNEVFGAVASEMYQSAGGAEQQAQQGGQANTGGNDTEVTDVDFEEVKDEKK